MRWPCVTDFRGLSTYGLAAKGEGRSAARWTHFTFTRYGQGFRVRVRFRGRCRRWQFSGRGETSGGILVLHLPARDAVRCALSQIDSTTTTTTTTTTGPQDVDGRCCCDVSSHDRFSSFSSRPESALHRDRTFAPPHENYHRGYLLPDRGYG